MLHAKDGVRVRQRLVCPLEDKEIDRSQTAATTKSRRISASWWTMRKWTPWPPRPRARSTSPTSSGSPRCVYSLRAREQPTVSTPVSWAEIDAAVRRGDAGNLHFLAGDAVRRFERHGDLFEPVLTLQQ